MQQQASSSSGGASPLPLQQRFLAALGDGRDEDALADLGLMLVELRRMNEQHGHSTASEDLVKDVILKVLQRLFGGQSNSGTHQVTCLDVPPGHWRSYTTGPMALGWLGNPSSSVMRHRRGLVDRLRHSSGDFFNLMRTFRKDMRVSSATVTVEINSESNPLLTVKTQLYLRRTDHAFARVNKQIYSPNQHVWDAPPAGKPPSGVPFLFLRDDSVKLADIELTHFVFLCFCRYPIVCTAPQPFCPIYGGTHTMPPTAAGGPAGQGDLWEPKRSTDVPKTLLVHAEVPTWLRRSAYFELLWDLLGDACQGHGQHIQHARHHGEMQNFLRLCAEHWFDVTPIVRHHVPEAIAAGHRDLIRRDLKRPQMGPYSLHFPRIPDLSHAAWPFVPQEVSQIAALQSAYLVLCRVLADAPCNVMSELHGHGMHSPASMHAPRTPQGGSYELFPSPPRMPTLTPRTPPLLVFQQPLFDHLRVVFHEAHRVPISPGRDRLDLDAYNLEVECWLLWLQPWKIACANAVYSSQQWRLYVAGNLHFYTTLLGLFFRAQSKLPNCHSDESVQELQVLEKVMLCFSDAALVADIRELVRDFRVYYSATGLTGRPVDTEEPAAIANSPARHRDWDGPEMQCLSAARWQHQQLFPALRYLDDQPGRVELLIEESPHCGIADPFSDRESLEGVQALLQCLRRESTEQRKRDAEKMRALRARIPAMAGMDPDTFWFASSLVLGLAVFALFITQNFFGMFLAVALLLATLTTSGGAAADSSSKSAARIVPRLQACMDRLRELTGEEAEDEAPSPNSSTSPRPGTGTRRRAATIGPHDGRSIAETHGKDRVDYVYFHSRRFDVLEPDAHRRHIYSCEFPTLAHALIDWSILLNSAFALPAAFECKDDPGVPPEALKDELLDIKTYPVTWDKIFRRVTSDSAVSWMHPRQKLMELCGYFRFNLRILANVRFASLLMLCAMRLLETPCVAALYALSGLFPTAWVLSSGAAACTLVCTTFLLLTAGQWLGTHAYFYGAQSLCFTAAAVAVVAFCLADRSSVEAFSGPWAARQIYLMTLMLYRLSHLLPAWYVYANDAEAIDW